MTVSNRAYSLLTIKTIDEDKRILEGIATSVTPDRTGDVVEPDGASFELPLPLLWQHDSHQPIGHVIEAKVSKTNIRIKAQIAKIEEPGALKDRIDECWQTLKAGLVRGLSIGFKGIETSRIEDSWSYHYLKWLWLELSCVTIAAQGEATITAIKSIDRKLLAGSGRAIKSVVITPAGVSATKQAITERKNVMAKKTIAEQIAALEETRRAKAARLEEIQTKAGEAGRTKDASEREEWDTLREDITSIDDELKDLKDLESLQVTKATTVKDVKDTDAGSNLRGGRERVEVRVNSEKLEKGIRFARLVKCMGLARLMQSTPLAVAEMRYKHDQILQQVIKADIAAGSVGGTTWGHQLVGDETDIYTDFVDFLRAKSIIGKFGANGIPALHPAIFRTPLLSQTAGGTGHWVGEGKPIPLTKQAFARTTLDALKVAAITPITKELLQRSAPQADALIRDDLVKSLSQRLDVSFVDPGNAGEASVSPASITNGLTPVGSTGNDADAIRADLALLFAEFDAVEQPLDDGVFLMSSGVTRKLSLMRNAFGQKEFTDVNVNGGALEGIPIITSNSIAPDTGGHFVILVNASDIWLGDEGGVEVDMSDQASLNMVDNPTTPDALVPTEVALVSLWQTDALAFRAKREINWKKRRSTAVAYLNNVNWGTTGS